jgi:hypothetical protein
MLLLLPRGDWPDRTSIGALPGSGGVYALMGQLKAQPGQHDALLALLLANVGEMPGCRGAVEPAELAPGAVDAVFAGNARRLYGLR